MRKTNFQLVTEFNNVLGQGVPSRPCVPSIEQQELRLSLIREEAITELSKGFHDGDLVQIGDAIADGLVVVYGAANDCGLDADRLLAEVHRSNMSKLCDTEEEAIYAVKRYAQGNFNGKEEPIECSYRPCTYPGMTDKFVVFNAKTGKTLKGPNYFEPDIAGLIKLMIEESKEIEFQDGNIIEGESA